MAEKRKPDFVVLLKKRSKKNPNKWLAVRLELFHQRHWKGVGYQPKRGRYRLRVGGKWYKELEWATIPQVGKLILNSLRK